MQIVWKPMSGGGVVYSTEPLALTSFVSVKFVKDLFNIIITIVNLPEVCYIGHFMQVNIVNFT